MKTKRSHMKAIFTTSHDNAKNMHGDKETTNQWIVTDKKTEREIVTCRAYMSRSTNASVVYASVWINGQNEAKKPQGWEWFHTAGHGNAGGYGYHRTSAAVAAALRSAGVELYGSPYNRNDADVKKPMARRVHFGGCGDQAVEDALLAVAYAAGCTDAILTKA
jgi:hypothetical protein